MSRKHRRRNAMSPDHDHARPPQITLQRSYPIWVQALVITLGGAAGGYGGAAQQLSDMKARMSIYETQASADRAANAVAISQVQASLESMSRRQDRAMARAEVELLIYELVKPESMKR